MAIERIRPTDSPKTARKADLFYQDGPVTRHVYQEVKVTHDEVTRMQTGVTKQIHVAGFDRDTANAMYGAHAEALQLGRPTLSMARLALELSKVAGPMSSEGDAEVQAYLAAWTAAVAEERMRFPNPYNRPVQLSYEAGLVSVLDEMAQEASMTGRSTIYMASDVLRALQRKHLKDNSVATADEAEAAEGLSVAA